MSTTSHPAPALTLDSADEILLDVAVAIEPTPNDMRLIEVRYRRLLDRLSTPTSRIGALMTEGHSLIYAQGSVSICALVLSGDQEDRCDVDAIVEIDVPDGWSEKQVLDTLFDDLKNFPDAVAVIRCTRCVQIQFATMHMDVTPIDKRRRINVERAGDVFHSPDTGPGSRVPANPAGFTRWFRENRVPRPVFEKRANELWSAQTARRLANGSASEIALAMNAAEQIDLPPMIPSRVDAIEVVALKLAKRFLINWYNHSKLKKPPSIWVTKLAGDLGAQHDSLAVQLYALAEYVRGKAENALKTGFGPDERNPSYFPDKLNDRWPRTDAGREVDLRGCIEAMEHLKTTVERLSGASLDQQKLTIDEIFGARVGTRIKDVLRQRYQRTAADPAPRIETGTGQVFAPTVIPARPKVQPIPKHHFHSGKAPSGVKEWGQ